MTEHVFRSSIGGRDEYDCSTSMKKRTVIARFGRQNQGMFMLSSELVAEAVIQVLPAADVVALGCLRGNHEWHITVATREACDTLLAAGHIRVTGPNAARRTADLEPLVPREVHVRVLWCPAWVPQEAVYELVCSIADVAAFERCRGRVGDYAVHNLQYTAILKNTWPGGVPDRATLEIFGEKIPLLFITRGKPRSCFLCGSLNHTQAGCPNPFCRYCNRRGHVVTNCPKKRAQAESKSPQGATAEGAPQAEAPSTQAESAPAQDVSTSGDAETAPVEAVSVNVQTPKAAPRSTTADPASTTATKRKLPDGGKEGQPPTVVRKGDPEEEEVLVIPETQVASESRMATETPDEPVDLLTPLVINEDPS